MLKRKRISDPYVYKQFDKINDIDYINLSVMKKEYKVSGMMCDHCRARVEKALNSIPGVKASVSLTPPVANVEFTEAELPMPTLQDIVNEKAGEYLLTE